MSHTASFQTILKTGEFLDKVLDAEELIGYPIQLEAPIITKVRFSIKRFFRTIKRKVS